MASFTPQPMIPIGVRDTTKLTYRPMNAVATSAVVIRTGGRAGERLATLKFQAGPQRVRCMQCALLAKGRWVNASQPHVRHITTASTHPGDRVFGRRQQGEQECG
eukprot:CAMPEP_0115832246 /NCGR_PEP_ID=MMETSP0287-20121206/2558_1 /TAXON_ID=412157 /ORGANISM="Chrysochromulina rotalis, Strain UIO044" /LENGTH=104 /DNA_ID=CAMNT_0003285623 /DNA_START=261 /DNA_END=572 /DNA_ORIENTATION=+